MASPSSTGESSSDPAHHPARGLDAGLRASATPGLVRSPDSGGRPRAPGRPPGRSKPRRLARGPHRRDRGVRSPGPGEPRVSRGDRPQPFDVLRSGNMVRLPDPPGPLREPDDASRRGRPVAGRGTGDRERGDLERSGSIVPRLWTHASRRWEQCGRWLAGPGGSPALGTRTSGDRPPCGNSPRPGSALAVRAAREPVGLLASTPGLVGVNGGRGAYRRFAQS